MFNQEFADSFAEALVREIKAEMGRQSVSSSRALGRIIGQSSQYMSDRLDGGSSKTGKRITLNAKDIASIALALSLEPSELVERAEHAISTANNVTAIDSRRPHLPADAILDSSEHDGHISADYIADKAAKKTDE